MKIIYDDENINEICYYLSDFLFNLRYECKIKEIYEQDEENRVLFFKMAFDNYLIKQNNKEDLEMRIGNKCDYTKYNEYEEYIYPVFQVVDTNNMLVVGYLKIGVHNLLNNKISVSVVDYDDMNYFEPFLLNPNDKKYIL